MKKNSILLILFLILLPLSSLAQNSSSGGFFCINKKVYCSNGAKGICKGGLMAVCLVGDVDPQPDCCSSFDIKEVFSMVTCRPKKLTCSKKISKVPLENVGSPTCINGAIKCTSGIPSCTVQFLEGIPKCSEIPNLGVVPICEFRGGAYPDEVFCGLPKSK